MYFLTVRNLGVDRCIDISEKDHYKDGGQYSCSMSLHCPEGKFIREVQIRCADHPGLLMKAEVHKVAET